MNEKILALCITVLVFCAPLKAGEISYSNFAIIYTDSDGSDGGGFGGSVELNENVYLIGSFAHQESDLEINGEAVAESDRIDIGIGYHTPLSESTDFVISATYIEVESEFLGTESDDDGYSLNGGVRSMVSDTVELNGGITHISDGDDSETGIFLGAAFNVSDSIALIVNYVNIDSDDAIGLGVRFGM